MSPRQSGRTPEPTTNMTGDKDFNPTTHQTYAQVTKNDKHTKTQNTVDEEETMVLQQNHDINSLNGDTTNYNTNKAQTLADTMCDFNETFKTEENFSNSWQQSIVTWKKTLKKNSVTT